MGAKKNADGFKAFGKLAAACALALALGACGKASEQEQAQPKHALDADPSSPAHIWNGYEVRFAWDGVSGSSGKEMYFFRKIDSAYGQQAQKDPEYGDPMLIGELENGRSLYRIEDKHTKTGHGFYAIKDGSDLVPVSGPVMRIGEAAPKGGKKQDAAQGQFGQSGAAEAEDAQSLAPATARDMLVLAAEYKAKALDLRRRADDLEKKAQSAPIGPKR